MIEEDLQTWSQQMFGTARSRNLVSEARSAAPLVNASRFLTVVHGRDGHGDMLPGAPVSSTDSSASRSHSTPAARRVMRSAARPGMRQRSSPDHSATLLINEPNECSICLAAFEPGQRLKQAPCPGRHRFHESVPSAGSETTARVHSAGRTWRKEGVP